MNLELLMQIFGIGMASLGLIFFVCAYFREYYHTALLVAQLEKGGSMPDDLASEHRGKALGMVFGAAIGGFFLAVVFGLICMIGTPVASIAGVIVGFHLPFHRLKKRACLEPFDFENTTLAGAGCLAWLVGGVVCGGLALYLYAF